MPGFQFLSPGPASPNDRFTYEPSTQIQWRQVGRAGIWHADLFRANKILSHTGPTRHKPQATAAQEDFVNSSQVIVRNISSILRTVSHTAFTRHKPQATAAQEDCVHCSQVIVCNISSVLRTVLHTAVTRHKQQQQQQQQQQHKKILCISCSQVIVMA